MSVLFIAPPLLLPVHPLYVEAAPLPITEASLRAYQEERESGETFNVCDVQLTKGLAVRDTYCTPTIQLLYYYCAATMHYCITAIVLL